KGAGAANTVHGAKVLVVEGEERKPQEVGLHPDDSGDRRRGCPAPSFSFPRGIQLALVGPLRRAGPAVLARGRLWRRFVRAVIQNTQSRHAAGQYRAMLATSNCSL